MKYNLDKLKKVDLRDVWPHEALDFTRWLSEEPNLAILSSAVGIELIETESSVGSFNVDIYAQEAGTGRKVIIENQLEDTNHNHLGKVKTQRHSTAHKRAFQSPIGLFPLNGRRWLWSDVVGYAVNASNLADNARRNAG